MCGIYGVIGRRLIEAEGLDSRLLSSLGKELTHRGPDDSGELLDLETGVALGHRRLAIQDLSSDGAQPMTSRCGRYTVVFNGEIYNFVELRADMLKSGHSFTGTSDTEVLVESIAHNGLADTLSSIVGMFAFALYDRKRRKLILVRDRMGEKPLYYGHLRGGMVFASELKVFCRLRTFEKRINSTALTQYLRYGYVPDPYCIFDKFFKVRPGHLVEVEIPDGSDQCVETSKAYWSLNDVVTSGEPFQGDYDESVEQLDGLLRQSVRRQLRSDVPLGGFLSGGKDSSLVAAIMAAESERKVSTFTIGFDDPRFDESKYARTISDVLGTDHHEGVLGPNDALGLVDGLARCQDEPFADSSQLPTMLVSQLAKKNVTVILSGDGGDELFGGYRRYSDALRLNRARNRVGAGMRRAMAAGVQSVPVGILNRLVGLVPRQVLPKVLHEKAGERLHRISGLLGRGSPKDLYLEMLSKFDSTRGLQFAAPGLNDNWQLALDWDKDFGEWMMALDSLTYLPGDILTKVDRAGMAYSLETRIPFLDHKIVEFAWSLPYSTRCGNGYQGKRIVADVLRKYLDDKYFERPKMGFGIPLAKWFRCELRDWGRERVFGNESGLTSFLDTSVLTKMWDEHQREERNWSAHLWIICMLTQWAEEYSVSFS